MDPFSTAAAYLPVHLVIIPTSATMSASLAAVTVGNVLAVLPTALVALLV